MSQNFDESPISDNKMDISDSVTSQENSTGVSPVNDLLLVNEMRNRNSCDLLTPANKKDLFTDKFAINHKNTLLTNNIYETIKADNQTDNTFLNMKLDNDKILNCFNFGNKISNNFDNIGMQQDVGKPPSTLSNSNLFRTNEMSNSNLFRTNEMSNSNLFRTNEMSNSNLFRTNEVSNSNLFRSNELSNSNLFRSSELSNTNLFRSSELTNSNIFRASELTNSFRPSELTNSFRSSELASSFRPSELTNSFRSSELSNSFRSGELVNSFRSSELTLANSHPLMSPPGTDSDSENGAASLAGKRTIFSFPDVVPESETIRLASVSHNFFPITNNKLKTFDSEKKTKQTQSKQPYTLRPQAIETYSNQSDENNFLNTSRKNIQYQRKLHNQHYSNCVQATPSPDLISSSGESEPDISQYQATVEPNLQAVLLVNQKLEINPEANKLRKIPVPTELLNDDISDSVSNHSFDDPNDEPNLASLSPSSSFDDFGGDYDDDLEYDCDLETSTTNLSQQQQQQQQQNNGGSANEPIPTYSVAEERRDSRNWQKITLPDGKVREIDMRVVEPYKRVLSHGGYLKAGGHNAIVMFCACFLPDRSRTDYHYVMDNLFLYVVKTLEQLVTEDYVLIYLHGGSTRRTTPPFPWLKKCYQLLDRRLRKSLKHMYLVHPTFWLKSVVCLSRPFVSSKFWRKLIYVNSLDELYSQISVEKTSIPDKVKTYDTKYK